MLVDKSVFWEIYAFGFRVRQSVGFFHFSADSFDRFSKNVRGLIIEHSSKLALKFNKHQEIDTEDIHRIAFTIVVIYTLCLQTVHK